MSATLPHLDATTKDAVARPLWMTDFDPTALPPGVAVALAAVKNSAETFGERMRDGLRYLLDTKPSFVPDHARRYGVFTEAAAALDARAAYAMTALLGLDSSVGYQSLPDGVDLPFPAPQRTLSRFACRRATGAADKTPAVEIGYEFVAEGYVLLIATHLASC